jgi:hypothetical protein
MLWDHLEPSFYWVVSADWGSGIENLYGFGTKGYTIEEYYSARANIGVPDDLLPIGDDGCCSFLCIGIRGERCGMIFYVDHEYEPQEPEKIRRIANSFSEFLQGLSEGPDY